MLEVDGNTASPADGVHKHKTPARAVAARVVVRTT
jgi:hypothetical protein